MSTPSVSAIAVALQSALGSISGLNTAAYLSDLIDPPVALVAIDTVEYHGAFGGADVVHTFIVHLIADRADTEAGIEALEAYMSQAGNAGSIIGALEADPTLGGVVSSLRVTKAGPMASLSVNGNAAYVWVPFEVEVHA